MRYLSVCSGIEAATVAWHPLGWTPVAFSEIEPFPAAVLAHHYPNVPNYGDMTKHKEWPLEPGSIDLLVGGTPCQAFSVAGLRGGLSDPRGGLMLTYLEIARRLRPKWVVWENVPGVLSSGGGRDFGSFLGALGELGYGWAYRVIDAQYCRVDGRWPKAVPQRRRRVFVVGCDLERDPGGRERAAEVLALGTGLRWHLAESGKTRKAAPSDAEAGVGAGSCYGGASADCSDTVTSKWSKGSGGPSGNECDLFLAQPSWPAKVAPTLNQSARGTGAPGYSDQELFAQGAGCLVPQPVPIQDGREIQKAQNGIGIGQQGDPAYTLDTTGAQAIAQPVPYDLFQITAPVNRQNRKPGDPCHTLARDNAAHAAVAFTPGNLARGAGPSPNAEVAPTQRCSAGRGADDQRTCVAMVGTDLYNGAITGDVAATMGTPGSSVNASGPTVMAFPIDGRNAMRDPDKLDEMNRQGMGIGDIHDPSHTVTSACVHAVAKAMTVRRLTPKEAERLQAFPDDYTLIPWRRKPAAECPDGPRYKALGNSMAVNCMAWIGERIAAVETNHGAASAPPSPPTPGTGGAASTNGGE